MAQAGSKAGRPGHRRRPGPRLVRARFLSGRPRALVDIDGNGPACAERLSQREAAVVSPATSPTRPQSRSGGRGARAPAAWFLVNHAAAFGRYTSLRQLASRDPPCSGHCHCRRTCSPRPAWMAARGAGASQPRAIAAMRPFAYGSKLAVRGLTIAFALSSRLHILVNAVAPASSPPTGGAELRPISSPVRRGQQWSADGHFSTWGRDAVSSALTTPASPGDTSDLAATPSALTEPWKR